MNQTPNYDGCIEKWKLNLAMSRIRALGFPKDQWPDLLQRLVPAISQFQFDPRNGAKESTALYVLITNQLTTVRRSQVREEQRLARHRANNVIRPIAYEDRIDLRLDVRLTIATLPDLEQSVCVGLMEGGTINQIASELGCTWHTVGRIIGHIRDRFADIGLDGCVCG